VTKSRTGSSAQQVERSASLAMSVTWLTASWPCG